jgi:Inner membrane component of T3SS, cytoplasmic domain
MALVVRIYYNAVYGAIGGLLGWMLFGIFGDKNADGDFAQTMQMLLGGAIIGGCIGYLVVSVEAIRDGALIRIARLATYGVVLGAVGGAIGMFVGDAVKYFLTSILIDLNAVNVVVEMLTRGIGWTILGIAIGMSEGLAARSLGKFSYGTLGGALGGFLGGCLFGLFYYIAFQSQAGSSYWANALGLVILGACIGSLSALVQGVFQPASVKVMRGWQEGREYPLEKAQSLLGRDEHADIALFRDMNVEKKHALVKRVGLRFVLINNSAPARFTLVNDQPVPQSQELHDGDRIQLGNVLLRFQARAAVNRRKGSRLRETQAPGPKSQVPNSKSQTNPKSKS